MQEDFVNISINREEFTRLLHAMQDIVAGENINPMTVKNTKSVISAAEMIISKLRKSFFGINDSE